MDPRTEAKHEIDMLLERHARGHPISQLEMLRALAAVLHYASAVDIGHKLETDEGVA
jgi:hypothetical protein